MIHLIILITILIDSSKNVLGRSLKTLIKNGVVVTSYDKDNASTKVGGKDSAMIEIKTDPSSIFRYFHKVLIRPILVSFGLSNYLDPTISSDKSGGENKIDDLHSNSSDSIDNMEKDHINHLDTLKYSNNKSSTDDRENRENREYRNMKDAR